MRILEDDIILRAGIVFILLVSLLILNIYILVCKKRSVYSTCIHLSSFFMGIFLFSTFMKIIIIQLPIEAFYEHLAKVSFIISLVVGLSLGLYFVYTKKTLAYLSMNPDISSVLTAIDDPVIIFDYNKHIIGLHKADQLSFLNHQSIQELDQLIDLIQPLLLTDEKLIVLVNWDKIDVLEYEIYDDISSRYYKITIAPMMADRRNVLGVIVIFHDISIERQLVEDINNQNTLLESANQTLEAYVEVASSLEQEKERLKLMGEIQSDLIINIEKIISKIRMLESQQINDEQYQKEILDVGNELRSILQTIRISVNNIASKKGAL